MTPSFDHHRLGACLNEETPVAAPEVRATGDANTPARVDLRPLCSPVEDQGDIGSCAANAVVGAMEYHQRRHDQPVTNLSRLFVYYNARKLADNEANDSGTFIHHAMAAVMAYGACPETMWPYQRPLWAERPSEACYQAALEFEAVSFARTPLGPDCRVAVALGLPVVFGACLPAEMLQLEAARTGRVEMPRGGWPAPGGGHAMLIVGYDDADDTWLIRNSWGPAWGDGGYARVSRQVLARYAMPSQFWVIGDIAHAPGLTVRGPSSAEALKTVRDAATQQLDTVLSRSRLAIRSRLESNLSEARKGFRDRLRGPGAGGGY